MLIVDDNATNRRVLEEWLRGHEMEPASAGDGVTAMDAIWHGVAHGRPYPLVLLDGRMPDVDGLALAAKIRQRKELSATRIILMTSGDRPGDLARRVNCKSLPTCSSRSSKASSWRPSCRSWGSKATRNAYPTALP